MPDELTFTTKLWQRSQSSHATTVPQAILAARGIPVNQNVEVNWRIDQETRNIIVDFEVKDD